MSGDHNEEHGHSHEHPDHADHDDHGDHGDHGDHAGTPGGGQDDHHDHPGGIRGFVAGVFSPHSHDAADSIDTALTASAEGMRTLKISLVGLAVTAGLQVIVVVASGSVALLGDTIHNFADALTAVPLGIAFLLGRRAPTKRYTYGYGRAEDLAGIFVVAMIALSSAVAGWEAVQRLFHPRAVHNIAWVMV
ncbi:MAG: cation diffusion facilitator family transporter, partial [Actinomycetota bacterium]|nr:cation diffusion facilitator family transporter [Actinomycetota bacterium]